MLMIFGFMYVTLAAATPVKVDGNYTSMNDCYEKLAAYIEKFPDAAQRRGNCQELPIRERSDMNNGPDTSIRFTVSELRALIK